MKKIRYEIGGARKMAQLGSVLGVVILRMGDGATYTFQLMTMGEGATDVSMVIARPDRALDQTIQSFGDRNETEWQKKLRRLVERMLVAQLDAAATRWGSSGPARRIPGLVVSDQSKTKLVDAVCTELLKSVYPEAAR